MTLMNRTPGDEEQPEGIRVIKPDIQLIRTDDLYIDPRYQREVDWGWVAHLTKAWDPEVVETLTVSPTPPKRGAPYAVVDGQSRRLAAGRLNIPALYCTVKYLTLEAQAQMFTALNKERRGVNRLAIHKANLVARDRLAIRVEANLDAHGLHFVSSINKNGSNGVASVAAVYRIAGSGFAHLDNVLTVILSAWDGDPDGLCANMLNGLDLFLRVYAEEVTSGELQMSELARKLGMQSARSVKWDADQRSRSANVPTMMARAILGAYNYRRSAHKLEDRFGGRTARPNTDLSD